MNTVAAIIIFINTLCIDSLTKEQLTRCILRGPKVEAEHLILEHLNRCVDDVLIGTMYE